MIRIRHKIKNPKPKKEASFETKEFRIDYDTDLSLIKPIEVREEEFSIDDDEEEESKPVNVVEEPLQVVEEYVEPITDTQEVVEETSVDEIEETPKKKRVSLRDKLNVNA